MKSVNRCSGLVSLFGLAVLMSACEHPINLVVSQKKVILTPKPGEHLVWANNMKVEFLGPSPCTETAPSNECHVKTDLSANQLGKYYYVCDQSACDDPEVDVGSGTGPLQGRGKREKAATLNDYVGVSCSGSQVQVAPPALPGGLQSQNIIPGSVVNWEGVGTPALNDWVVTFSGGNTSVCNESTIQAGDNTACTIKPGLTPNAYNYSVTSPTCTGAGSGKITTSAP